MIRRRLIILVGVILMAQKPVFGEFIKESNVSGQFYAGNPSQLNQHLDQLFSGAKDVTRDKNVRVLISPHAGYIYSGGVAAFGFEAVKDKKYSTIVLVGPSHYHGFPGASIWPEGGFKTPLGVVSVDNELAQQLMKANAELQFLQEAFTPEHSLEVQLPFIQRIFPQAKIVPILMGTPDYGACQTLAKALAQVIGRRDDVLVLVSTDLSHYHNDAKARAMDDYTIKEAVLKRNPKLLWDEMHNGKMEMCGFTSTIVGLLYAMEQGWEGIDILKYANSGDANGDKGRVVGYASVIIYDSKSSVKDEVSDLSLEQKRRLIAIARQTVDGFVKTKNVLDVSESDARLSAGEGAFVTINKLGQLRGCIGNIIGTQPLYKTIRDMAVAAASEDPRFSPVMPEELPFLEIEISVLSKPRLIKSVDEIIMGKHGVIVSRGFRSRGVFLPQVATETGWSRDEFLSQLCSQKAGLPADCWKDPKTQIEIFSAQVFSEHDVK